MLIPQKLVTEVASGKRENSTYGTGKAAIFLFYAQFFLTFKPLGCILPIKMNWF